MTDIHDIRNRDDIAVLVEDFYTRGFADPLLGHIFVDVAQMDLAEHMPRMCDFWETVIFRAGLYKRNALQVHVALHAKEPLTAEHFGRWVDLWHATIDDHFTGENAEHAKVQGARIAWSMSRRLMGESGSEFVTITRGTLPDR